MLYCTATLTFSPAPGVHKLIGMEGVFQKKNPTTVFTVNNVNNQSSAKKKPKTLTAVCSYPEAVLRLKDKPVTLIANHHCTM